MSLVRNPPSGPPVVIGGADVTSLFGRTGHVVAEVGDYNTALVFNDSSAPGGDIRGALLLESLTDWVTNQSGASGATVSDALNALLARLNGVPGYIRDSFTGGAITSGSATNTNARLGDRRWNFHTAQANASAAKLPGAGGTVGVYRVTNGHIYLGRNGVWPFEARNWGEFTFRARVEAVMGASEIAQFGLSNSLTQTIRNATGAGISAQQNSNPNFVSVTSLAGSSSNQDTGVAIDGAFHTFRAVRVSANEVQFFIDGVLRTTHIDPFEPMPAPDSQIGPIAGAFGSLTSTFVDVDDFEFIPA